MKSGLKNAWCQDTTPQNILFWWRIIWLLDYANTIQKTNESEQNNKKSQLISSNSIFFKLINQLTIWRSQSIDIHLNAHMFVVPHDLSTILQYAHKIQVDNWNQDLENIRKLIKENKLNINCANVCIYLMHNLEYNRP